MSTLFLLIIALIGGLMAVISWRPENFKVTRSATLNAPPEAVFPHINNLHKWDAWSPWTRLDPNAKNAFEGPEQGVGSSMSWTGDKNVGVGRMTITESVPGERVRMRLEFEKPMKAVNTADFTLRPEGAGTFVTWSMFGKNNFIGKAFDLFMNCEKMVGGQFEKGLENLRQTVEAAGGES